MSTRASRLPVSPVNAAIVAGFLLAAAGTAAAGQWGQGAVLAGMGLFGLAAALHARRQGSRDVTRVNAIEYRDERDRTIAREGFAAVGAAALVLSLAGFVVVGIVGEGQPSAVQGLVTAQLLVLAVMWAAANHAAARRH
jgi:hypothetical protein